jgi:hypothetical protein
LISLDGHPEDKLVPGSYTLFPESRFVYSRAWGLLTEAVLIAHSRALAGDPRFQPSFAQLSDLREVTEVAVTGAGVREAAAASPFGVGSRRALVASSDLIFGMARMYEVLRENAAEELMVFRDVPAALRWLGTGAPSGWHDIPAVPPDWLFETD